MAGALSASSAQILAGGLVSGTNATANFLNGYLQGYLWAQAMSGGGQMQGRDIALEDVARQLVGGDVSGQAAQQLAQYRQMIALASVAQAMTAQSQPQLSHGDMAALLAMFLAAGGSTAQGGNAGGGSRDLGRFFPQSAGAGGFGRTGAGSWGGPVQAGSSGGAVPQRLYNAIIRQESGGNYRAVNPHSGALGIGQVMPANVASWSREALGYSITPQQFLNSPELQDRIIQFKLDQYYREAIGRGLSPDEAVRYVASKWYSGSGDNRNSTRPQNGYPSISAYTHQVLARYHQA
jgi:Transglycosylase SLT domain